MSGLMTVSPATGLSLSQALSHPALVMLLAGLLIPFVPAMVRRVLLVAVPAVVLWLSYNLQYGEYGSFTFINNMQLVYLKVDELSWVFVFILAIVSLTANLFALRMENPLEAGAQFLYVASSMGVVLAGDWLTLIFFWELMAVASVFLVWSNKEDPKAKNAGFRYLLVHFLGGNVLLAGIFLKVSQGNYLIGNLADNMDLAGWLILIGVAVNAAIYPLHAWLPDAYPRGTVTGSVFLSCLTTKVAVYCLVRVFPGVEILIWGGVLMCLVAVSYAMIANDLRVILSFHIISQVGYMVAAAGLGTELALNGSVAHAFSNILYKSLLFMGAGAILYATGTSKLTELGGLFKRIPWVVALYFIGSLAISGFPYLNGFTNKAVILSAASYAKYPSVELLLYLASVGTLISTCLKVSYYAFAGEPKKEYEMKPVPWNMYAAMAATAALCFVYGIFPNLLYNRLPFPINYVPYTFDHVISTVQIILAATFIFVLLADLMKPKEAFLLDVDWFYRVPLVRAMYAISKASSHMQDKMGEHWRWNLQKTYPFFANPMRRVKFREAPLAGGAAAVDEITAAEALHAPLPVLNSEYEEDGEVKRTEGPEIFNPDYYRLPIGAAVTVILLIFLTSFIYVLM